MELALHLLCVSWPILVLQFWQQQNHHQHNHNHNARHGWSNQFPLTCPTSLPSPVSSPPVFSQCSHFIIEIEIVTVLFIVSFAGGVIKVMCSVGWPTIPARDWILQLNTGSFWPIIMTHVPGIMVTPKKKSTDQVLIKVLLFIMPFRMLPIVMLVSDYYNTRVCILTTQKNHLTLPQEAPM